MNQLTLSLAGAVALSTGLAHAQEVVTGVVPIDAKNISYAGVYNAATGVLSTPARAGSILGDPIYANNSLPGSFYNIEGGGSAGAVIIDEGRVPGITSTNVLGTQESYALTSLQIAYVTDATDPSLGGTGIDIELNIYENFAPCGLLETTDAPIATILLTGLPGSTSGGLAGQLMDVDLNGLGICLRADGDDEYSDGTSDLFGWSMQFLNNADGTGGGPFLASQPLIDAPGDGTAFQNPGVAGSGLDTQDLWRQLNPSGTVSCFFFGGYPANAFSSFYMVVRSDLAGECIGCGVGDDRFEPNDDAMSAVALNLDSYGSLISNLDQDWYSITMPPNSGMNVDMLFSDAISDLDIRAFDAATMAILDSSGSGSDNEDMMIANCDLSNGLDVLIRVLNFDGNCNEYDLILSADALFGDDALEENDECSTAVPLPIGITENLVVRPYCGSGTTTDDGDYYGYTLMPGDTLTVDALFIDEIADIDLVLYDVSGGCNGTSISTGFTISDNEHVSATNGGATPLELVVRVDHFSGRSNTYTLVAKVGPATIGELICLGNDNSVGSGARVCAVGSDVALDDDVTLDVTALPLNSMGYFIVSQDTLVVTNPGGSAGNICIASYSIGRYAMSVLNSGMTGAVSFSPALTPIAMGGGSANFAAMSGDTVNWQYWYRDTDGMGMPTSNFSDAVGIGFN